ncbi:type II toxin-antitoxin system VapC family toxin [Zoogloea sp.]|uniref:type II toxin-antitoxin system VapC family toxin n=1 Tax=Zoogloea sp. TaxID=49181 RepID=UPI0025EE9C11|nr:type II toxin-antitoxin system VapC family toxin [Zoogloea sp.]MCK6395783.1 type II toxin-antitoxin system VapC family toxin [Zoogloea sp.]
MTGVLVDTSVWVDHLRQGNPDLIALLHQDSVMMHPLVLGEIACGTPPARTATLSDLGQLQHARQATVQEVLDFVGRERLFGQGCGFIDMCLLASALLTPGTRLWTLDKRLAAIAERFEVSFNPQRH